MTKPKVCGKEKRAGASGSYWCILIAGHDGEHAFAKVRPAGSNRGQAAPAGVREQEPA